MLNFICKIEAKEQVIKSESTITPIPITQEDINNIVVEFRPKQSIKEKWYKLYEETLDYIDKLDISHCSILEEERPDIITFMNNLGKDIHDLLQDPNIQNEDLYKNNLAKLRFLHQEIKEKFYNCEYTYITDVGTLKKEIELRQDCNTFGIDTETTGLNPLTDKLRLIQISSYGHRTMIIDMLKLTDPTPLNEFLQRDSLKIFHNAKFDLKFLMAARLTCEGSLFDTMIAAQLIDGGLTREKGTYTLKTLCKKYLDYELSKEEQVSDWTMENLSEEQLLYASKDAVILLHLRDRLRELLIKCCLGETARLEFDCLYSVADMELNGFFLDKGSIKELEDPVLKEVEAAEKEIRLLLGDTINLHSPKQLLPELNKLGIKADSTDKEILKTIDNPIIDKLIDYKEKQKFFDDNIKALPEKINLKTGRLHAEYNQTGTSTGRFSCSKPNLQQIPRDKRIRNCFQPEAGNKFVIADYSQIELRIAAELSQDETMLQAYSTGADLHKLTASHITGKSLEDVSKQDRQLAKAVNFGLIYGAGAKRLKDASKSDYGVEISYKEAETFRNKFFELYRGLKKWHSKEDIKKTYTTYTLGGRYRKFDRTKEFKLTDRLNTPDQGTGADILKKALVLLRPKIKSFGKLVHIVHDEIILEVPEANAIDAAKILKETMEEAGRYYLKLVPVEAEVSIGSSWADK